ncbi:MAG: dTDP-4-dehydrorhamnose reductase [Ardenticatenia bacterium]|nr:dTDP-4-dehydrorhamnose reductase [Ardenticatenia bacterium]
MRVLITGGGGQVGCALQAALTHHDVLAPTRTQLDVTNLKAVLDVATWSPDVIVHTAAMTNVDGCEQQPERAYLVNALGTRNVALLAQKCGATLCYVSTDYVFDGQKGAPYWEWDLPNPLNVYGASKLAGEWFVQHLLDCFYIARTAWVYGPGGRNFPRKVVELAAQRPSLGMVVTEAGHPTYAPHLAQAIARLIETGAYGLYHVVNEGCATRYELARAVLKAIGRPDYPLEPLTAYPRPAKVPPRVELHTVALRSLDIALPHWTEGVTAWAQEEGI